MNVARVTVSAMTQGLMMGRDFGLGADWIFGLIGGATGGAIATGGSNTAWLAKVGRLFPLPQWADVRDDVMDLYMTIVLYPQSDVLRWPEDPDIFDFGADQDLD
jgi:hypothetical protein